MKISPTHARLITALQSAGGSVEQKAVLAAALAAVSLADRLVREAAAFGNTGGSVHRDAINPAADALNAAFSAISRMHGDC